MICYLVKVLCADIDTDYQRRFEEIIREEYEISWLHEKPKDISNGKYVVLFKVKYRMPHDAAKDLTDLGIDIKGKTTNENK